MSPQIVTLLPRARPYIPDYELLRPIGRGAYGEVWLARNVTGSWVALKIVHRSAFDHERPFEREFEGIKRFEPISRSDPSQVAILHVGLGDGFFYYVMELADDVAAEVTRLSSNSEIRNPKSEINQSLLTSAATYQPKTLKRLLNDRGVLPAQECLAIAFSLTRALAHLHGHGLVHRDVKLSNVIFVNGQAKLADIGLVTSVDATRSFVGTEGYLPPEGAGTPQADLFALGKLLYEMSTGCDRKEFPALPLDIATRPDRDTIAELNAIVIRACQLDPRERYASADAMRDELTILQRGQSVKRRRAWQRALIQAKKLALAGTALLVMTAIVYWLAVGRSGPPDFQLSKNQEANLEYRQAVQLLHAGDNGLLAVKHFTNAIALDPGFAEAYARLAFLYISGAVEQEDAPARAKTAVQEALKLNPNSSFAHAALASVKVLFDLDWAGAEEERRRAIKLNARGGNPNSEEILLESALNLVIMGKRDDALKLLKQAQARIDSPSVFRFRYFGFVYEWARQFDEAIKTYGRFIEVAPGKQAMGHELQARAYLGKEDYTNAIHFGRLAALEGGEDAASVKAKFDPLENALKEGGSERFWQAKLELEKSQSDERHLMRMAAILARLKRPDEAFAYLDQAREKTSPSFCGINTDPSFDSLREDRRFQKMIYELWHKK